MHMKTKIISKVLLVTAVVFCYAHHAHGQRNPPSNTLTPGWDIKPAGCELNDITLEQAHDEAGDTIIVLLARPALKSDRKLLLTRRLYTARAYLTDYLKRRSVDKVATAEAPNSGSKYGVIEIYVKGLLFDVLAVHPGDELALGSCDSLDSDDQESRAKRALLYPWHFKKK